MKKSYKTLLFDLDDTLLDFAAAEDAALTNLFKELQIPLTEDMKETYKMFNQGLWRAHEKGEIGRDELVNTRFSIFFEHYGKNVDGAEYEKKYRNYLKEGAQLIEGALEVVERLSQQFDLYIVTNGVKITQQNRLKRSGLLPYFQHVFVSEEVGFQKPRIEFFNYVFSYIGITDLDSTIIIGDSLSSDIKGANVAGIDSCWFNPVEKENATDSVPTYQIKRITELYEILNK